MSDARPGWDLALDLLVRMGQVRPEAAARVREHIERVGEVPVDADALARWIRAAEFDDATRTAVGLSTESDSRTVVDPPPATQPVEPVTNATVAGPPPGSVLGRVGPYRLLSELGRGGMGVVYRARDLRLDREVALKTIVAAEFTSAEHLERFHLEAAVVARMGKHPHIVQVHDVGRDGAVHYYTMDLVQGTTLRAWLAAPRTPRQVIELVHKVAGALAHAHALGIIHRDLKPENILVDTAGEPQVTDFGLARDLKEASRLSATGQILGTPQYMAPEQACGFTEGVGPATDVYTLGVILYEAFAGRTPFGADDMFALLHRIAQEDAPPLRRVAPGVSAEISLIVMKCLENDPARRYHDGTSLAAELKRFLDGEPIEARAASAAYRLWKRVRRAPLVWGLSAALAVAALATAGLAWRASVANRNARERERASERERARLAEGYLDELARSGRALVDAALARRALGDLAGSRACVEGLDEPIRLLWAMDPRLAEPWYHRGRMDRALGNAAEAERDQDRAVTLARAADAPRGSRAILPFALYERSVLRSQRFSEEWRESRLEVIRRRAEAAGTDAPPPELPSFEEVLSTSPDLDALRRDTIADLQSLLGTEPLPPGDARADVARGLLSLLKERDHQAAGTHLSRAIEVDRYLQEGYTILATSAEGRGAWEEAAGWYERGHAVDRGHLPHLVALARILEIRASVEEDQGRDGDSLRQKALARIDEALDLDASRADLHVVRGEIWASGATAAGRRGEDPTGRLDEAEKAAKRALAIEPSSGDALLLVASVCRERGEAKAAKGEDPVADFAAALEAHDRALQQAPRDVGTLLSAASAWYVQALWKMGHGQEPLADLVKAVGLNEQALLVDPRCGEAEVNIGTVWWARATWRKAGGHDPTDEYQRAAQAFQRALAIDPRRAEALYNEANCHRAQGGWEEGAGKDPTSSYARARAGYEKVLAENPRHSLAAYSLGNLAKAEGDRIRSRGEDPVPTYRRAIEGYERAIAINPRYAQAANNGALAWRAIGEAQRARGEDPSEAFDKALAGFERAVSIHPRLPEAANGRGLALRSRGDWMATKGEDPTSMYEAAIEAFGQALTFNPKYANAPCNAGGACWALGSWRSAQGQDASKDFERALSLYDASIGINPHHAEAHNGRAVIWLALASRAREAGQDAADLARKGIAASEDALRINPSYWYASMNRGRLLEILGRDEEALDAYARVLQACPGNAEAAERLAEVKSRLGPK